MNLIPITWYSRCNNRNRIIFSPPLFKKINLPRLFYSYFLILIINSKISVSLMFDFFQKKKLARYGHVKYFFGKIWPSCTKRSAIPDSIWKLRARSLCVFARAELAILLQATYSSLCKYSLHTHGCHRKENKVTEWNQHSKHSFGAS